MNEFQAPPPFAQMMLKPGLGEVCPLDSFPCMGLVVGTPLRVPLLLSGIMLRGAGVGDSGSHPAFSEVGGEDECGIDRGRCGTPPRIHQLPTGRKTALGGPR